MKEIEIKKILIKHLMMDKNNILSSEFRFDFGSRRADIISLKNNELVAYEIKGAGDNTARLDGQIRSYKKYFDRCYIVCESSNISTIRKKTPNSIGIFVIEDDDIRLVRKGMSIKKHDKVVLASTIDTHVLRKEISNKKLKSKHDLCEQLALEKDLEYIRKMSRNELLTKIHPSYKMFINELGESIHSDDILTLSRMSSLKLIF